MSESKSGRKAKKSGRAAKAKKSGKSSSASKSKAARDSEKRRKDAEAKEQAKAVEEAGLEHIELLVSGVDSAESVIEQAKSVGMDVEVYGHYQAAISAIRSHDFKNSSRFIAKVVKATPERAPELYSHMGAEQLAVARQYADDGDKKKAADNARGARKTLGRIEISEEVEKSVRERVQIHYTGIDALLDSLKTPRASRKPAEEESVPEPVIPEPKPAAKPIASKPKTKKKAKKKTSNSKSPVSNLGLPSYDKSLRDGLSEFIRQVNREYTRTLWDAQEKDRCGYTTVKEMDKVKDENGKVTGTTFEKFYSDFIASAGKADSKVTPEMANALKPYKRALSGIHESRSHQFAHLFHSENSRTATNLILDTDAEEMRANPDKNTKRREKVAKYGESWAELYDLKVASGDSQIAELLISIETLTTEKTELEARITAYESGATPSPVAPVQGAVVGMPVMAGFGCPYASAHGNSEELKKIYERLESLEALLNPDKKAKDSPVSYKNDDIVAKEPQPEDNGYDPDTEKSGYKKPEMSEAEKMKQEKEELADPFSHKSDEDKEESVEDKAEPEEKKYNPFEKICAMGKAARKTGFFDYAVALLGTMSNKEEFQEYHGNGKAELLCELGVNLIFTGHYDGAEKCFVEALKEDEVSDITNAIIANNLEIIYRTEGKIEDAAKYTSAPRDMEGILFYDEILGWEIGQAA